MLLGFNTKANAQLPFGLGDCTSGELKHDTTVTRAAITITPINNVQCGSDTCNLNTGDTCSNCCCFVMNFVNLRYYWTLSSIRMIANDDSTDFCHFCYAYGKIIGHPNKICDLTDFYNAASHACSDTSVGAPFQLDTTLCGVHFKARTFGMPNSGSVSHVGGGGADTTRIAFCLGNPKNPNSANTCHHLKLAVSYVGLGDCGNHFDTLSFPICCDSTYHYCADTAHQGTIAKEISYWNDGGNVMVPRGESLIYPNPATGVAIVEFTAPQQGAAIMTLTNMTGLQVHQDVVQCNNPGKYNFTVDTRTLSAGTYICTIRQGDNFYNKVFIVVK
jgi:hypothetical protein